MRYALPLALLCLAGCAAGANLGPHAAERKTQSRDVQAAPADAFRAAAQVAAAMGWTIRASDADTGVITAATPGTLSRWDDEVSVVVAPEGGGSRVTVRSGLANGPNVAYVGEYLDAVEAALR